MVPGQQSRTAVTARLWTTDDPPAWPPPIPVPAPLRACPPARSLPVHPAIRTRGRISRSAEGQLLRRAGMPVSPGGELAGGCPAVRGRACELPEPYAGCALGCVPFAAARLIWSSATQLSYKLALALASITRARIAMALASAVHSSLVERPPE